jgi:hypothetical protein
MNKGVIHIVLVVLAVLAAAYGDYMGIGASHNLAIVFGGDG